MSLKKVVAVQDNDGHWYVIPHELSDEFRSLLEESQEPMYTGDEDEDDALWLEYEASIDAFEERFNKYLTGGDLNLVELYANIQ